MNLELPAFSDAEESLLLRFDEAWESGAPPDLAAFLPDRSKRSLLIELVRIDVQRRLQAGLPVRTEDYLVRFPELSESAQTLAEWIETARRQTPEPSPDSTVKGSGMPPPAPDLPPRLGRYRVQQEIARGGMGKVVRVHDEVFDRPLALKVLLGWPSHDDQLVERFLREARLTGQLQHPGVPPVQEMGRLEDGRPYFIMKLIEGCSLAKLLRERPSPSHDLPRFVSIFEQICHTLGYVHAQGILHRDLKPANIMVGAFGEVQVMDWGLAKQESGVRSGASDTSPMISLANPGEMAATTIDVPAPAASTLHTRAGSVMGTPAYMPPEQARGEINRLDARADVFGLGAILCDILTGKPPFAGSPAENLRQAQAGDLTDAFARLDGCGADAELISLGQACLNADAEKRPWNASVVADAIAAYQANVQERLRAAETARAVAQAKAVEGRKRRRFAWALAAAAVALILGVVGFFWWRDRVETALQAESDRRQALAEQDIENALSQVRLHHGGLHAQLKEKGGVFKLLNRPAAWQAQIDGARAALRRAKELQAGAERPLPRTLAEQIREMAQETERGDADRELALALDGIRLDRSTLVEGKFNYAKAAEDYPKALGKVGLDVVADAESEIAQLIGHSAIREQLVAALDDFAFVAGKEKNKALQRRLLNISRLADPDPWRDRIRDLDLWHDAEALEKLTEDAMADKGALERLSPQLLGLVGTLLFNKGKNVQNWFKQALHAYPADFWLHFDLGTYTRDFPEGVSHHWAALAVRPDSAAAWYNFGVILRDHQDPAGAVAASRKAIACDSGNVRAWINLGVALQDHNDLPAAVAAYQKALDLNPKEAIAWSNLGTVFRDRNELPEAIAAFQKAVEVNPRFGLAWYGLGDIFRKQRELPAAIAAYKNVLPSDPVFAKACNNLGLALQDKNELSAAATAFQLAVESNPKLAEPWANLGIVLYEKDLPAAIAAFQRAVKLDPKDAKAWTNLGTARRLQKDNIAAITAFKNAVQFDRKLAKVWYNLGNAYYDQRDLPAAIAAYKNVLELEPKHPSAWINLGLTLHEHKDLRAAVAAYREALRIQPRQPTILLPLGRALQAQGEFSEALTHLQQGHELGSQTPGWSYPSAAWVKRCQRLLALEQRLAPVLAGAKTSPGEQVALADLCQRYRQRYRLAAQLYADAFAVESKLAEDLTMEDRYNAARAAALAAAGKGKGVNNLDEKEGNKLRGQALAWLRGDLAGWRQAFQKDAFSAATIQEKLKHWQTDTDLASVRDDKELARLPKEEQTAWLQLWADVEVLRKTARLSYTETTFEGALTAKDRE